MSKKYRVIKAFKDLEDNDYIYDVGKPYPRSGNAEVSIERINELLGANNKLKTALIEVEKPAAAGNGTEETNLEELTVAELKEIANQLEVEGYTSLNKGELVEAIKNESGE